MKGMFIMYARYKKSTHKRKIPANLEKDNCVYFKVKNKLGMCVCWCEIKLIKDRERKMRLYLATANKIFFFFF